jgi:hypothetical protein
MMTIFDIVPENTTPEAEISRLANCDCCAAHKNNKPTTLKPWTELPMDHADSSISNKDASGFRKCQCDCRHKARFICRKFCIA